MQETFHFRPPTEAILDIFTGEFFKHAIKGNERRAALIEDLYTKCMSLTEGVSPLAAHRYALSKDSKQLLSMIRYEYSWEKDSGRFKSVEEIKEDEAMTMTTTQKQKLLTIPTLEVIINNKRSPLMVALQSTTSSLAQCFEKKVTKISYPELD